MNENVLDASTIDEIDDYDLTGEIDEPVREPDEPSNDPEEDTPDPQEENDPVASEPEEKDEIDFTTRVLQLKGITDPTKIKFEDEFGEIIERSWDDLSDNERLNILANNEDPERDLEDDEIQLINTLRANNLTPQQYITAIQNLAMQLAYEQIQQSQVPTYEIDLLSDDELFALDLLEKVGEENISDEELQEALEQAKSNEALFAKQIEGLRATYKNLEDQQKYNAEQAQIEQAELQYQEFSNSVLNEIGSFNSLASQEIELSTEDKNDIANYMLTRRDTGISDFYADMQDPSVATLAAFWLLKGPEVLNEMENQIKAAYQRGVAKGKSLVPIRLAPKTSQVVVQLPAKPATQTLNVDLHNSAFGLEDDSYLQ